MTKATVYIAKDGKQFSRETDCLQYEADGCVEFEPIPSYGDRYPVSDLHKVYWILNGDGDAYYATDTRMSRVHVGSNNTPEWATQIIYFGK